MEKHKLDSFIKNKINESKDFYDSEAILAKKRIWSQVRPQKQIIPLFYRLLAAASILLLFGLSVMTFYNIHYKSTIDELVETNTQLKSDQQIFKANNEIAVSPNEHTTDTIYIEKKIVETKPVVTTKYIRDTVYVEQIVYVEKNRNAKLNSSNGIESTSNSESKTDDTKSIDKIASNSDSESKPNLSKAQVPDVAATSQTNSDTFENNIQREIIIKSEEDLDRKKTRKFRIKFGGSNSKMKREAVAIRTEI